MICHNKQTNKQTKNKKRGKISYSGPLSENKRKRKERQVLKKLSNMRVMVIPVVIGAFGTVPKGLERGLEELELGERIETIQIRTLL